MTMEHDNSVGDPGTVVPADDEHARMGSELDRIQAALDEVAATIARMS